MKRKILFINHEETITGACKILLQTAKFFKKKYEVVVWSLQKGNAHDQFNSEFKNIIYEGRCRHRRILNTLKTINPDLVYGSTIGAYQHLRIAKKHGFRTILHIHELDSVINDYTKFTGINTKELPYIADCYIAVSEEVKKCILSRGVKSNKIHKIHEFVNEIEIQEKISKFDRKNKKRLNVITIGNDSKRKGFDILCNVINRINKKRNDIFFTWVGGEADTKNTIKNFKHISTTENPYIYLQNSDIFVLPSREDPFPLVCLEAMCLGKPVIAYRSSGGIHTAIENCGVVVNEFNEESLVNAICKLADYTESDLRTLGDIGKLEFKEKYSYENAMNEIEKIVITLFKK